MAVKLYVAFGYTNVENARMYDPKAEEDLKQFYGEPMYNVYEFETQAEADAFKFAVEEMENYLIGYIVQK